MPIVVVHVERVLVPDHNQIVVTTYNHALAAIDENVVVTNEPALIDGNEALLRIENFPCIGILNGV